MGAATGTSKEPEGRRRGLPWSVACWDSRSPAPRVWGGGIRPFDLGPGYAWPSAAVQSRCVTLSLHQSEGCQEALGRGELKQAEQLI